MSHQQQHEQLFIEDYDLSLACFKHRFQNNSFKNSTATKFKSLWPCSGSKGRNKYNKYLLLFFYGILSCIRHPSTPNQAKPVTLQHFGTVLLLPKLKISLHTLCPYRTVSNISSMHILQKTQRTSQLWDSSHITAVSLLWLVHSWRCLFSMECI